jgi:hypothetical protein
MDNLGNFVLIKRYLDESIDLNKTHISLSLEFIFNLDETGLFDWEEKRPKPVLVTADTANHPLYYQVHGSIRRQRLPCCVSASGDAHWPLFLLASHGVLSRFDKGVRGNVNLQIKIVDSPYVTSEIYIDSLRRALIPPLESSRSTPGCQNKSFTLLSDDCIYHCSDDIKRGLAEHGISLTTYPPHTFQIFQMLETLLFWRLKVAKKPHLRDLTLGVSSIV